MKMLNHVSLKALMNVDGFLRERFTSCANINETVYTHPDHKVIFSSNSSSNAWINVPSTKNHKMITTSLSEQNQLSYDHNQHETAEDHTEQTSIYEATYIKQTQAREANSTELQNYNQRIHENV